MAALAMAVRLSGVLEAEDLLDFDGYLASADSSAIRLEAGPSDSTRNGLSATVGVRQVKRLGDSRKAL